MDDTQTQPRTKVLKNGAVYDLDKGRIVANPGGGTAAITKENASKFKRARQEKTARLLRQRITEATNKASDVMHNSSASAAADVGGILWSEIVLNPEAYPRDRMDAFEKLGKLAEIIPDGKDKSEDPGQAAAGFFNAAAALLKQMTEHIHATPEGYIDGLVPESGISESNNVRIGDGSGGSPAGPESEEE